MNILYEESGKFKAATIVQKNNNSYQVDTQYGKRVKVKESQIFVEFSQEIEVFFHEVGQIQSEIDTDFLWEVADGKEFALNSLAVEYFGVQQPNPVQMAALLMTIYDAPIYFYKKGKGIFKAAPKEALEAAKASLLRKQEMLSQKQEWMTQLQAGVLPQIFQPEIMRILHCPEKQNLLDQAFLEAAEQKKLSPINLAIELGAIHSPVEFWRAGFLLRFFPNGVSFPTLEEPRIPSELPVASVQAFSIDDKQTTEIDDAFSVTFLEDGMVEVGVHIAVPSIAIAPGTRIERLIFERLSTVYFPGEKIVMLPSDWSAHFSLDKDTLKPAISLYLLLDSDFNIKQTRTAVEKIHIADNLCISDLELMYDKEMCSIGEQTGCSAVYQKELSLLYTLSRKLISVRGKDNESQKNRFDFLFEVNDDGRILIKRRQRDSSIDMIIGEMMIYANAYWAGELARCQLPAMFRGLSAGKVKMSTQPLEHANIGVAQYAWCSAPLRRASDYINQRQLLSIYLSDLPARFETGDAEFFALMRSFETTYSSYAMFQQDMELLYTLMFLQQESIHSFVGIYIREGVVRAEDIPLIIKVSDQPADWSGKRYVFLVKEIDLWSKTIVVRLDKECEA